MNIRFIFSRLCRSLITCHVVTRPVALLPPAWNSPAHRGEIHDSANQCDLHKVKTQDRVARVPLLNL
jgi:hypothetical protein